MPAPARNTSVVTLRAKGTVATPPLSLGYSSLIEPDTYDPEKPTFKLNGHFLKGETIEAFKQFLVASVLNEKNVQAIRDEMVKAGIDANKAASVKVIDAETWLENKLKEPKEDARFPHPHIIFANKANYRDREGNIKPREIKAWDAKNNALVLKKLRMGPESLIQVVVYPNLYYSKLDNLIQPSLKLVGVRILGLKQYARGGAAPAETDEEAIKEVLGSEFVADDLSEFAAGLGDDETPDASGDKSLDDEVKDLF